MRYRIRYQQYYIEDTLLFMVPSEAKTFVVVTVIYTPYSTSFIDLDLLLPGEYSSPLIESALKKQLFTLRFIHTNSIPPLTGTVF